MQPSLDQDTPSSMSLHLLSSSLLYLQCLPLWCFSVVSSLLFSCSVVSNSLRPHGLQHTRLPCPSPTPGACSNSCPLSRWCHTAISSSVVPFSSRLQSFPASGSFQMSQFFTSGGQRIWVSVPLIRLLNFLLQFFTTRGNILWLPDGILEEKSTQESAEFYFCAPHPPPSSFNFSQQHNLDPHNSTIILA